MIVITRHVFAAVAANIIIVNFPDDIVIIVVDAAAITNTIAMIDFLYVIAVDVILVLFAVVAIVVVATSTTAMAIIYLKCF